MEFHICTAPNPPLEIQDHNKDLISVEEKSVFAEHKSMGHQKAPGGTRKAQFKETMKKAITISTSIHQCPVGRKEARTLFDSIFRPSIGYIAGQTFFSDQQMQLIQKKSMPLIYAKCGFNRNTSKAILQGPGRMGGGNFIMLEARQLSDMLRHFVKIWRQHTSKFSHLLRAILSWSQHHSGLESPILMDTTIALTHIDGNFITTILSLIHI